MLFHYLDICNQTSIFLLSLFSSTSIAVRRFNIIPNTDEIIKQSFIIYAYYDPLSSRKQLLVLQRSKTFLVCNPPYSISLLWPVVDTITYIYPYDNIMFQINGYSIFAYNMIRDMFNAHDCRLLVQSYGGLDSKCYGRLSKSLKKRIGLIKVIF